MVSSLICLLLADVSFVKSSPGENHRAHNTRLGYSYNLYLLNVINSETVYALFIIK